MSILNILGSATGVFLYADTWGATKDDVAAAGGMLSQHVNKIGLLAAANCVVACRGTLGFFEKASLLVRAQPQLDFDRLLGYVPSLLSQAWTLHAQACHDLGIGMQHVTSQEFALVGWSELEGRVDAVVFMNDRVGFPNHFVPYDGTHELESGVFEPWITPWSGSTWGPLPPLSNEADHLALARAQVRLTRRDSPAVAIGGRLVGAEITRNCVRVFQAGPL